MTESLEDTVDIYAEFGLTKAATTAEIKRAYRLLALKHHPDKLGPNVSQEDKKLSEETFKMLSKYYAVLSNPDKRATYDRTGLLEERDFDDLKDSDVSWDEYFKTLWTGVVTEEAIDEYEKKYRYSEEERADVLKAYIKTSGCLLDMIDSIPLSKYDDLDRFKSIIQSAIDAGEVQKFAKFPQVNKRELKKRIKEANQEAQVVQNEKDQEAQEKELSLLIQSRNKGRMESLVAGLEAKYSEEEVKSTKKKSGKGKKNPESPAAQEPSEEEFMALQAKLFGAETDTRSSKRVKRK